MRPIGNWVWHLEGLCFPGEQSVLNYEICAKSFAKMRFRISICVKTELCLEFSSLESCSGYMNFKFSKIVCIVPFLVCM